MYLQTIQIRNFKNHSSSRFDFGKGANTVIGENDSGKSNAMQAIRILLDSEYFYNNKRLKETDFSSKLNNWKGHWIIISAAFANITSEDKQNDICLGMIPEKENASFFKSHIRCKDGNYGTLTLFIRPNKNIRSKLFNAKNRAEFCSIRDSITLLDYEFYFTTRSQTDFLDEDEYKKIVGDLDNGECTNPENDDSSLLGVKVAITDIWQYISVVFIDALRDVENELRKPKNPLRRAFDVIQDDISSMEKEDIEKKISELNETISKIKQVSDIGKDLNNKLNEIVGLIYSPDINIESKLKADIQSLSKYLSVSPSGFNDIELLGLGHLNILYIALKLVEFEYRKNHEILNIMIIEEPEAHIHIHIQKTLFNNLKIIKDYTQIIMTTHSTHLSEIADISRVSVLKSESTNNSDSATARTIVMKPTNGLELFARERNLSIPNGVTVTTCLERYLDAKRTALLFSKGVILVEGDGEEILLPALVKKALGISLDEIGISVINIGSVAFEYIASIFSPERLQRHCAIVTDRDSFLENTDMSSERAAELGKARKDSLDSLSETNPWIKPFYAIYTFEVDFSNIPENLKFIKEVIESTYKRKTTIKEHIKNLEGTQTERYDEVLKLAKAIGKGWYATALSSIIDESVFIPEYLCAALAFASKEIVSYDILRKMAIYVLNSYAANPDIKELLELLPNITETHDLVDTFDKCCKSMNPKDPFVVYYNYLIKFGVFNGQYNS